MFPYFQSLTCLHYQLFMSSSMAKISTFFVISYCCDFYFFGVCELELNDPKEEDSHFKGTIIHKTDVGRGIHA